MLKFAIRYYYAFELIIDSDRIDINYYFGNQQSSMLLIISKLMTLNAILLLGLVLCQQ